MIVERDAGHCQTINAHARYIWRQTLTLAYTNHIRGTSKYILLTPLSRNALPLQTSIITLRLPPDLRIWGSYARHAPTRGLSFSYFRANPVQEFSSKHSHLQSTFCSTETNSKLWLTLLTWIEASPATPTTLIATRLAQAGFQRQQFNITRWS